VNDDDGGARGAPPPLARVHDPALDGLRGLAILLVLLYHFNVLHQPRTFGEALWRGAMNAGWVGVDLFFVLSGFLITGILLDDKARVREASSGDAPVRVSLVGYLARFSLRRVLRIFPLYYAFLFASFVVLPRAAPFIGNGGITTVLPDDRWWFWLYLPNFLFARLGEFVGGRHFHLTWSLGVEEQFYLCWPLVVWFLDVKRLRALCIGLIVCAPIVRAVLDDGGASWVALFVWPHTRMDTLASGALLATFLAQGAPALTARARAALSLVVVVALLHAGWQVHARGQYAQFMPGVVVSGLTLNALGFAALTALVRASPTGGAWRRAFSFAPLRLCGRYAYGLYLVHVFVQHLVVARFVDDARVVAFFGSRLALQVAFTSACTLASLALAVVVFHTIEEPFLRLKRVARSPR